MLQGFTAISQQLRAVCMEVKRETGCSGAIASVTALMVAVLASRLLVERNFIAESPAGRPAGAWRRLGCRAPGRRPARSAATRCSHEVRPARVQRGPTVRCTWQLRSYGIGSQGTRNRHYAGVQPGAGGVPADNGRSLMQSGVTTASVSPRRNLTNNLRAALPWAGSKVYWQGTRRRR